MWQQVKNLRIAKGVSQRQVAWALGISQNTYAPHERGRRKSCNLELAARALRVVEELPYGPKRRRRHIESRNYFTEPSPHIINSNRLCDRLLLFRRTLGISQKTIASALGVTTRSIYTWECGMRLPSPRHKKALLEFLNAHRA